MATALPPNYGTDSNDELWRECSKWLTKWEMIRPDHKANWEDSSIADLASILRDGVLLCNLLNKIEPGCVDMKDVNLKPIMAQFLCLHNINLFLKTCKSNFGLNASDLFEDSMLFDLTNFHKVLCTLSKLSNCEKALRSGITGFSAQPQKSREEEVIYQSLSKILVPPLHTPNGSKDPPWRMFTIPCPRVESKEDIYDDLCYVTFQATLSELASPRGLDVEHPIIDTASGVTSEEIYQDLLVVRSGIEQPQPQEKRDFVIKELLDTERNYVDVLNKLKISFMVPLQAQMKPDDHAVVFHKIADLYELHSQFLAKLLRIRNDPSVKLSHIFRQFQEKFLIYGSYCANLTKATSLLQELCDQDDYFNQTIIKYEKQVNNGRFKLRDVLSVPMQRILKYHLLLQKLKETTEKNHDEHYDLERAWDGMLDVAAYINEVHRDVEHLNVINNLQETIVDWEHDPDMKLSDYGKLIKDAELKIKAHDDQKTRNRYVFIFHKCILICKQLRSNQFAFRDILNITEYHIDEIHNRQLLNNQARWTYSFLLVKNGQQMAYTIFVRTLELKEQIIKAIREAQDHLQPKALSETNHNFELTTFANHAQCFSCDKYLRGLIFQGYLCHKCNQAVHKDCIRHSGKCGVIAMKLPTTQPLNGINEKDPLRNKLWYVGKMDRTVAEQMLAKREDGTFLVRISPKMGNEYALSLKTGNDVKHMRICSKTEGSDGSKKYYLSQSRFFNTIQELILNYEHNSLRENFARLDENTKLLYPFHQLRAIVLKNHDAMERNQLTLREGQVLSVLEKEGYRQGWWKGRTEDNQIGYFPVTIIKLEGEVRFD